ncbi:hypothetical protein LLH23_11705 [bacterium]|nr:hypothetical protein [bacterium]
MMKLRWPPLFLLAWALAVVVPALGQSAFDPSTMLDASQVKRGDRAVGRTVFSGVKITEFHLEIIDILKQANLGQDMILARILDGPVVDRQSGIVGGMSGSPVYVDGKLIGAVAWGWPFEKEPITGITPIRAMLEALSVMESPQAQAAPAARSWTASRPFVVGGTRYNSAAVVAAGVKPAPGVLPLRPVMTPVNCSGFGPQTLKLVEQKLGPLGLQPLAGGGAKADPVPVELEPGAAVGVRLMEGDFDMTGIGTVTWRQGDRLLAFGHPMMQLGRVNMPLATAWIHDFIPSYMRADKMGSAMADVGSLQADTAWSIGGRVGPRAPLIPARLEIVDESRHYTRVFNVKVFDQPRLTPIVLSVAISQALEAVYNPGYEGTVRTHFQVRGKRGASLAHDNQYAVQGSPADMAIGEVAAIMQVLEDNRWEPQGVSELVYRAELTSRDETLMIEKAYTEENVARAGKPLHLHVLLRPDGGELQDRVFTLNMPPDLPKGSIRIGIGPGDDALYFRARLGIMLPRFESLPEVASFVDRMEQNKQLCVVAALPDEGVMAGSTRLMRVPPSIAAVLEESTRTDMDSGKGELFAWQDTDAVVAGREAIILATEDKAGTRGTVTRETAKTPAAAGSKSSSSSKDSEESVGPQLAAPRALWWAESALKPAVAQRLRAEAAAAGTPWPVATPPPPPPPPSDTKKDEDGKAKPAAKDEAKPDAKEVSKDEEEVEDEDATGEAEDKALLRQPTVWLEQKAEDFAKGEANGVSLCSGGGLALAPGRADLGRRAEGYIWNAVSQGGTTYLATGMPGRVYRMGADGKANLLCDPGVFAIRGLAVNAKGEVFIGTWPGGKVFRLGADGKAKLLCELPCDYVWALAFDQAGRLLAGTGPAGKLFAVDASGRAEQVVQVPQAHIMAVLVQGDRVLLGSGASGVVYEWTADRRLRALLTAAKDEDVTSLVAAADGTVYAASAGDDGAVYRVPSPSAAAQPRAGVYLQAKDLPIYALALCNDRLYAATGKDGKLLVVTGEGQYETAADTDVTHLLCLAPGADGFVVGTGNAAEVIRFQTAAPTTGAFTSSVLDATRQSRWCRIDWQATVPQGSELAVQTRSGQSPDPEDGSWSVWSAPYTQPGQDTIASPAGRYLQYRVQMKSPAGQTAAPQVRWLSLAYLPANQRPTVEFDDDTSVEKPWKGKVEVNWTSEDPDKDALTKVLQYRPAGTELWQTAKELGADDDSYEWPTATLKDGRYDVRLVVSDEVANPGAGLSATAALYAVQIDNTQPVYVLQSKVAKDGVLTVEGIASDDGGVAEVAYKPGEQWYGALPVDGLFGGPYEQFRFTVPLDKDGKAKVSIRCRDAAGNVGSGELVWPVPEASSTPKKAEKGDKKE